MACRLSRMRLAGPFLHCKACEGHEGQKEGQGPVGQRSRRAVLRRWPAGCPSEGISSSTPRVSLVPHQGHLWFHTKSIFADVPSSPLTLNTACIALSAAKPPASWSNSIFSTSTAYTLAAPPLTPPLPLPCPCPPPPLPAPPLLPPLLP